MVDLERLFQLRLLVARFGEMDRARWWNTRGVLGRNGALALGRGFPKTHPFARARLVFAVAAERCRGVFDPPGAMTLWNLPAEVEDRLGAVWPLWIEEPGRWEPVFAQLEASGDGDLLEEASRLGLADEALVREARQLRRASENRAVPIPGEHRPDDHVLGLLALGFFRGEPGAPAVPYARLGGPPG